MTNCCDVLPMIGHLKNDVVVWLTGHWTRKPHAWCWPSNVTESLCLDLENEGFG